MEQVTIVKGKHPPLITERCDGWVCRTCPSWWKFWITGVELRGDGDNATFLHDADVDHRKRPYVKLTRARWRRVARRWTLLGLPALLAGGSLLGRLFSAEWPRYALLGYGATVGISAGWLSWRSFRRYWPDRQLHARYVIPTAKVLCSFPELRLTYRRHLARKLVSLPRGFGQGVEDTDRDSVRIIIPGVHTLSVQQKAKITTALAERLDMVGAVGDWRVFEAYTALDLRLPVTPPRTLTFADVRKLMLASESSAPLAGLGTSKTPVLADLNQDSPHVALSGKSGTGKSVLLRCLLMQRMYNGAGLVMLDYKRWSHKWLHDMPEDRSIYCYRIGDIHNFLMRMGEELHTRIECDKGELGSFREIDVVVEEINATTKRLAKYWKAERSRRTHAARALKKQADALCEESELTFEEAAAAVGLDPAELELPTQSPAIDAIQELVGMGRELQIHLWVAAQRLSAAVFGGNGGDIRESFDLRFMARWDGKLWKMLVDGMKYVVCPSGPRGIWGVQQDEEFKIFRVPWITDKEARDFVLSSPSRGPILGAGAQVPTIEGETTPGQLVTLSEALPLLPPGAAALSLAGLQSASKRDGFPEVRGAGARGAHLYDLDELKAWRAPYAVEQ